jgi:predicted kinase
MRLIVTVGLPRSGKSTWAQSTGFPVVCPDSIRLAIHGQAFVASAEPFVWAIAYTMIEALRISGHEAIVVDATNVTKKRRDEWERRYPGQVEYHIIDVPADVCKQRAVAGGREYLVAVIDRMAEQWDILSVTP